MGTRSRLLPSMQSRVVFLGTAGLLALFVISPAIPAGAAGRVIGAAAWLQAHERGLYQRAVARGTHPRAAVPLSQAVAAPKSSDSFTTVKGMGQISQDTLTGPPLSEPDTEVEPDIAVDPNNSDHITTAFHAGEFEFGAAAGIGFSTSLDGGRSWNNGFLPNLTEATGGNWYRAADPTVFYGPDGAAYAEALTILPPINPATGVAIQRSDDGGLTWNDPVMVDYINDGVHFDDKPGVTADTNPSSPHYGRLYSVWDQFDASTVGEPELLRYSDDRGETWSDEVCVNPCDDLAVGAIPVVQPNGDVSVAYISFLDYGIYVATSHDGGQTFDPPVLVDYNFGSSPPGLRDGGVLPSLAVDPTDGKLYITWQDARYRGFGPINDIVLSSSTDGGQTWSPIVRVNSDSLSDDLHHFTPDVTAYGGNVHLTYRTQNRLGGASRFVAMHYIHSEDGGLTWQDDLEIGSEADLRWAAQVFGDGTRFLGDFMGTASTAAGVHLVWCRSSEPGDPTRHYHQTAWSATILP
jgi:hypothetical protein